MMKRILLLTALLAFTPALFGDTETIQEKAARGYAPAQYNLGKMYDFGDGVPKDYVQAVKWYRLAAEQGHASAQFFLAKKYRFGEGVPVVA